MRSFRVLLLTFFLLIAAVAAHAGTVTVFMPVEESLSPMAMRQKAEAEAFAVSVLEAALPMLPGELDEYRTELLKEYMLTAAGQYILGYKVLSAESTDEGYILTMETTIAVRPLREGLVGLGLFSTLDEPLPAAVAFPEEELETVRPELSKLAMLTGIRPDGSAEPRYSLERVGKKAWLGKLVSGMGVRTQTGKSVAEVWYPLWAEYFRYQSSSRGEVAETRGLSVQGWFTPDGVHEFHRVLGSWARAVHSVELIEMDLQPSGVAAAWQVHVSDEKLLRAMLDGYLPQRGLEYRISEK